MTSDADGFTFTIRKRTWWSWVLAGLWLQLEVLLVQTVLASVRESEYRAAVISWISAAVLAAVGVFLWLRRGQSRGLGETSEQP
ncbi:MAG: hypothetical protein ABR905_12875 [Terracidiphilus sp.]|jgi:hypothetical protein